MARRSDPDGRRRHLAAPHRRPPRPPTAAKIRPTRRRLRQPKPTPQRRVRGPLKTVHIGRPKRHLSGPPDRPPRSPQNDARNGASETRRSYQPGPPTVRITTGVDAAPAEPRDRSNTTAGPFGGASPDDTKGPQTARRKLQNVLQLRRAPPTKAATFSVKPDKRTVVGSSFEAKAPTKLQQRLQQIC